MIIIDAKFIISAVGEGQYPDDDLPEIAFVGRSNIGKSSTINTLLNRRSLAKTSSTPGKTRTINFYEINGAFRLVDLPGYGFASVSKTEKATWRQFIDFYLTRRENLKAIIQLVDIRHKPSKEDVNMEQWIDFMGRPAVVVANKSDKIGKNDQIKSLKVIREELSLPKEKGLIKFSKMTGQGKEELWQYIETILEASETAKQMAEEDHLIISEDA